MKLHHPTQQIAFALVLIQTLLLIGPGVAQQAQQLSAVAIPEGNDDPRRYVCFRTEDYMRIDGKIKEEAWDKAPWTDDYRDIVNRKKPHNRVRSKMLWDDSYLYVVAEIEAEDIWAKEVVRDANLYQENAWELFIDPDASTHHYMELEINAFGAQWDLLMDRPYRDGGQADSEWNIDGLLSLVQIYGSLNRPGDKDDKWTVEVAVPWKTLPDSQWVNIPPHDGDQWRINMARVEWPLEVENGRYVKQSAEEDQRLRPAIATWSGQGLFNLHYPEKWGIVQFSDSLSGIIHLRAEKREVDRARWALRQVYYAQRNILADSGQFAENIAQLKLAKPDGKFEWPPEITISDSGFTAVIMLKESGEQWQIDALGEVRKTP